MLDAHFSRRNVYFWYPQVTFDKFNINPRDFTSDYLTQLEKPKIKFLSTLGVNGSFVYIRHRK